jgi:hypothetical protein
MTFATPEAFRASLEARIRSASLARRVPIARVRQLLVFDRFLARVFAVFGDRVVAKGGAVLELRIERARTTRDIDLSVTGDPKTIVPLLQQAGAMELGDYLSFMIAPHAHHPTIGGDGVIYEGQRFRVEARIARKIYGDAFGVDVAFGDVLLSPPDEILGTDFFAFAEVPRAKLRVYPRTTHIAEKLHAYTLPRERENSRVKDLPDIALLATTGTFRRPTCVPRSTRRSRSGRPTPSRWRCPHHRRAGGPSMHAWRRRTRFRGRISMRCSRPRARSSIRSSNVVMEPGTPRPGRGTERRTWRTSTKHR